MFSNSTLSYFKCNNEVVQQWILNKEWNAPSDIRHGKRRCAVDKLILSELLCRFASYGLLEQRIWGGCFNFPFSAFCIKNDESK